MYFLIIMGAYLAGNIYIYTRSMQMFATWGLVWKIAFTLLFWLLAFALIISLIMRDIAIPPIVARGMFTLGATWMVITLYMTLSLLAIDIIKLFLPTLRVGYIYAMVFTSILLLLGYYNHRHPNIEKIDIILDKPLLTKSVRVVAVSDVHLGYGTDKADLKRYVDMINAQNPDVILIGGDLIDSSIIPLHQQRMEEELNQLQAPMGIYMAAGNHEYISGIKQSVEFLKSTPVQLLRDSVVVLPCGLQIVGRDDRSNRHRKPLNQLLQDIDPARAIIVIDHQPYELSQSDALGVDLQFSGHTHHGQVWPLNIVTNFIYEQSHGYRKWPNAHIYVSSGLSLWGPPFRIGTRGDMAIFEISSCENR